MQDSLTQADVDSIAWIRNEQYPSTVVTTEVVENRDTIDKSNGCFYDNEVCSLGLGVLIVPDVFEIFTDSLLKNRFAIIDQFDGDNHAIPVCSKFFKPDYGIMHFVCLRETKTSYEVLTNYSDIKYLPKTKEYSFETWKEYILQSEGIRRLTREDGKPVKQFPLFKQASEQADTLVIPQGHELFCPLEIKGDWVKVTYDCFYNVELAHQGGNCHEYIGQCKDPVTGWLRWKQKNVLLIDILLMP